MCNKYSFDLPPIDYRTLDDAFAETATLAECGYIRSGADIPSDLLDKLINSDN
jgi:hypothetical protein